MIPAESNPPERIPTLQSRSFRITVDDGRESFFALSIEDETSDDAWLISDTVLALDNLR